MRLIKKLICIAAVAGALNSVGQVQAYPPTPFPTDGPTQDVFPSLGTFRIFVAPAFRGRITGCPVSVYNPTTFRLQSPTMYDDATEVGYSYPHTHGSVADTGGTWVGTAPSTWISDSNFTLLPPGFQGPAGEREVHTEVRSLHLTGLGGAAVRAGTPAPSQTPSPGEVESEATPAHIGDPAFDFPAESFFDVFVEVDMPACGSLPAMTLYNSQPLLVVNSTLTDFPPRVIYVHGNTNAVPVYLKNDIAGWGKAGDLFGWLVLAGHGASYTDSPADIAEFQATMTAVPEIPVPTPIGGIAELPSLAGASGEDVGESAGGSGWSAGGYAALAGGLAAAAIVIAGGGWYARRRLLK
jgi:hypothetical protein